MKMQPPNLTKVLAICFLLLIGMTAAYGKSSAKEESYKGIVNLTDSSYDKEVVDPSTNKIIGDRPWLLFFYIEGCGFCKVVKPVLEELAKKFGDKVHVGFIDSANPNTELLRETYGVPGFPHMYLLKGEHAHLYKGDRTLSHFKDFVSKLKHDDGESIPAKIGKLGLYIKYAKKHIFRTLKHIVKHADSYVFIPAKLHTLAHNTKVGILAAAFLGTLVTFTTTVFLFCKPKKSHSSVHTSRTGGTAINKPSSRSRREKVE